jgi:hypothetical protein
MRPSPAARIALVFSVSVAAALGVAGQERPAEQDEPRPSIETGLFAPPRVLDAPFAAETVTTWRPPAASGRPALSATSRLFRDRSGRVRVEQWFADEPSASGPHRILLLDRLQSPLALALDPAARLVREVPAGLANMSITTEHRWVVPMSRRCVVSYNRPLTTIRYRGETPDAQPLGSRMLLGMPATGTRSTTTYPHDMTEERWVAAPLGLELLVRVDDATLGAVEYEVTRLSLVDTSPRLFEIPPGYSRAEQEYVPVPSGVMREPYAWDNPYTLVTSRRDAAPCALPVG